MTRLVIVGDLIADRDVDGEVERLAPDAPVPVLDERSSSLRPGGAGLVALLARSSLAPVEADEVVLVAALCHDEVGAALSRHLADRGVELVDLGASGRTVEKVRLRCDGRPLLRLDRGGGPDEVVGIAPDLSPAVRVITGADAVVVADYGRGVAALPPVRAALESSGPLVWDPHRNGPAPVAGATLVTPNRSELTGLFPSASRRRGVGDLVASARAALAAWRCQAVAVTLGGDGALLVAGDGAPLAVPCERREGIDPCGAGDAFALGASLSLAGGAVFSDAVSAGVATASRYLASGGVSALARPHTADREVAEEAPDRLEAVLEAVERVRLAGGTVVATGGCFDVLHPGHLALLQSARRLGDYLVVCLNSDDSVRRLKGAGRPVVSERDRARLLRALEPVDAVVVFTDDSPAPLLELLRPHLFVKGGDYAGVELPETTTLARFGGEAVVVPYLSGYSTTRLLQGSPP